MNHSYLIFVDFETGGKMAQTCQPTQLAAVMIDPRKLEIVGEFNKLMRPIDDDKAHEFGLDPLEEEALQITRLTREELAVAPSPKAVWEQFCEWVKSYNRKGNRWNAPILCGFNEIGFDLPIMNRLAGGQRQAAYDEKTVAELLRLIKSSENLEEVEAFANKIKKLKEPYGFGPWDEKSKSIPIFHPRDKLDLMHILWLFLYEDDPNYKSLSFDNARDYLGLPREGAHNALVDVKQGTDVLTRFLKYFRKHSKAAKFKGSFANG